MGMEGRGKKEKGRKEEKIKEKEERPFKIYNFVLLNLFQPELILTC